MIDQAINYHRLAGSSKEQIAALKEKSAKMLLDAAAKTSSRSSREYYLTAVIDEHPETPEAREATRRLADLVKNDNQGLRMELRAKEGLYQGKKIPPLTEYVDNSFIDEALKQLGK